MWKFLNKKIALPSRFKRQISYALLAVGMLLIGVVIFFWGALFFTPFFASLSPEWKELDKICSSVKLGSTVDELREKYGALFYPTAITEDGDGSAEIINQALLGASCLLDIKSNEVIKAQFLYIYL